MMTGVWCGNFVMKFFRRNSAGSMLQLARRGLDHALDT
jgi:hypothetical protein